MSDRRRALGVLLACLVLLGSACAKSDAASGGGEEVDVCGGYEAYDELTEPDVGDAESVRDHASTVLRVLERVDDDRRVHGDEVPGELVDHLEVIEASMKRLRSAAASAGDDAGALRAAESTLFFDEGFRAADTAWATFFDEECGEENEGLPLDPSQLPGLQDEGGED